MRKRRQVVEKLDKLMAGKVIYLLALVVLVQFSYPITDGNEAYTFIIYQLLYLSMIVIGIMLARETRGRLITMISSAVLFFICGAIYAFNSDSGWALFLGYITILPFQATVIEVLLRFVFITRNVTRNVLYAASAAFLMLGGIFVPIYGLLENLTPGSFIDSTASHATLHWQQFYYYSYSTLTTMGHGDILPVSMWARSITSFESILGVLYLTIVMARLVGMYVTQKETGNGE
ncbi:MAG: two pore domain potassium channel family protein [bacterium]|nr:two pore domain potassium channel family protein [bacterium]